MITKPFRLKAVLFDFDGTLTKPGAIDFPLLKKTIGCPPEVTALEYVESLQNSQQRDQAHTIIARFETDAAVISEPNLGAEDLVRNLRSKGLSIGIVSRNRLECITRALKNFKNIDNRDFDVIISRDTRVKPKPSGDGILLAAHELNVDVKEILMVGDYIFDIQSGRSAGCHTVFLDHGTVPGRSAIESDFIVSELEEIISIVRQGLPLDAGKLPNDILEEFLDQFAFHDPSLLVKPHVGEDTAAVNVKEDEVLILKSDPITFATDAIGHYAVLINANDVATAGATPRWFLTTLMFPCGVSASEVWQVMDELKSVCEKWNITLCGGHTEITDAVRRPVVTGMLVGTVGKNDLIDKRNMRMGDKVLLTKGIAVEGTSIIAREFEERLKDLGMSEREIVESKAFLTRISIIEEATIAARSGKVTAMHDITEGGLATAMEELSIAGGQRIRIDMDNIPVFSHTKKICRSLGIDHMGLIGSGSLLICCNKDYTESLIADIRAAGIEITCIGEVLEAGRGIEAIKNGNTVKWPRFEVDEITRLF